MRTLTLLILLSLAFTAGAQTAQQDSAPILARGALLCHPLCFVTIRKPAVGDNARGIFGDLTNRNISNNVKKNEVWTRPVPK